MSSIQDERGINQVFTPVRSTIARAQRRHDWFAGQIRELNAKKVLEIGCGFGDAAHYVAQNTNAQVTAVDVSAKFITQARQRYHHPSLRYEMADFFDFQSGLSDFDFIYGNGILHHLVKNLPAALKRFHSILKPGGKIAFIEPNLLNPYCTFIFGTQAGRKFAKLDPDEMAFTKTYITKLLNSGGWKNINVNTRDFLVPGIPTFLIRPIEIVEPILEATPLTSWLAQSNFILAEKES